VTPGTVSLIPSGGQQFTATVTGTSNTAVTWSVEEGSACGAVSPSGLYSAPSTAATCHVVATSQSDSTKNSSATVYVGALDSWLNITPSATLPLATGGSSFHYGLVPMDSDDNGTIFVGNDASNASLNGVWKSTDYGNTWTQVPGTLSGANATNVNQLNPYFIRVSPANSQVVFVGDIKTGDGGVSKSTDGGQTFTQKLPSTWEHDMYWMDIDPNNPNHLLVTFHSPGYPGDGTNSGVGESFDNGETWTGHSPGSAWGTGQHVYFLGQNNSGAADTSGTFWLLGTQYAGIWRTENSGSTWTQVATWTATHGMWQPYRAKSGAIYAGSIGKIYRSLDNGRTWSDTGALESAGDGYGGLIGDGTNVWAMEANTGLAAFGPYRWMNLPETDTTSAPGASNWTYYGTATYVDGPYEMHFDATHRILYSSQWGAGLFKLQL
jgi:hypothetical protein